ncbi:MAG: CBS domain-containing protein [Anaerolineaceae bacterium]|nr:CBS domain-containing protein [Anaerolineaceae bacterium]
MANGKSAKDYASSPVCVTVGTPNAEAIRAMLSGNSRILIITDVNMHVKGVVSGTDFIREFDHDVTSARILKGNVENLMSTDLHYVTEDTIMIEVVAKMNRYHLQSIVVLHGLEAKGVIHQSDLLRWWNDEFGSSDTI